MNEQNEEITSEIYEALEAVRKANPDGLLVPTEVVAAARSKKSPLNPKFTWDDSEAGQKWREQEARNLIRVHVRYEPIVERKTRVYVSVPTDRTDGGGYRRTSEAIVRYQDQLVDEVRKKLLNMRVPYEHLKVLDGLWPQIDAVVANFFAAIATRPMSA